MPITRRRHQLIYEYVMQPEVRPVRREEQQLHRYGGGSSGAARAST
ncbi:MAG: hypothetical protein MZV70_11620 [Desulfobacterales bacterium]|nr:hypothetical protein [Desulfobacterales bacterium]